MIKQRAFKSIFLILSEKNAAGVHKGVVCVCYLHMFETTIPFVTQNTANTSEAFSTPCLMVPSPGSRHTTRLTFRTAISLLFCTVCHL